MEYDRVIANLYISPILFEWTTFIQYFFHNAAVGAADLSLAKVTPFWHWCSIWSCNAFGRLDLAAWRVVQFTVRCWNLELCELAFGIVRLFICKMLLLRSRFLSPILFWILGLFGRIISFINCDWWENVGNSDVFFFPWAGRTTLHKVWHFHYKLHTWYLLISLDQRKSCALKWSKIAPTLRFNILGKSNANIVCADSMERRCEVLPWALWQIMVAPSDRCFSLNRHVWALQTEALSCFFSAWSSLLYAAPLLSRERRGVWRCRLWLDLQSFLFRFANEKPAAKQLLEELPSKRPEQAETLRNLELRQNSNTEIVLLLALQAKDANVPSAVSLRKHAGLKPFQAPQYHGKKPETSRNRNLEWNAYSASNFAWIKHRSIQTSFAQTAKEFFLF